MKLFTKARITSAILVMGVMASFAGAVTSTLAWYAYSTTATLSYKGTSVAQSEQLQIGIMTTVPTDDPENPYKNITFTQAQVEEYGITYKTVGDKTYAFCEPGTGLDSVLISHYLEEAGYATNEIEPVSSHKYEEDDEFMLYQHLWGGVANNNSTARKHTYSKLPLAFRVNTLKDGQYEFAKNQDIWLSDAQAIADGAGSVYKAVRTHIKSDKVNFILNPSATGTGSYTVMGGLLDLNKDGYYDTTGGLIDNETEIVYGDYDGILPTAALRSADSEIDDVNKTGNDSYLTTFTAKHAENRYCYTKEDIGNIHFHRSYWKSISDIKPQTNSYGYLSGGKVLCTTSNDENAIAEVEFTVYLEGWDHAVIDNEINHKFALGLTFEINRVQ